MPDRRGKVDFDLEQTLERADRQALDELGLNPDSTLKEYTEVVRSFLVAAAKVAMSANENPRVVPAALRTVLSEYNKQLLEEAGDEGVNQENQSIVVGMRKVGAAAVSSVPVGTIVEVQKKGGEHSSLFKHMRVNSIGEVSVGLTNSLFAFVASSVAKEEVKLTMLDLISSLSDAEGKFSLTALKKRKGIGTKRLKELKAVYLEVGVIVKSSGIEETYEWNPEFLAKHKLGN